MHTYLNFGVVLIHVPDILEALGFVVPTNVDDGVSLVSGLILSLQASKPTFRLHIYVQLGSKRGSSGPAESSIASEVSLGVNPGSGFGILFAVKLHRPASGWH